MAFQKKCFYTSIFVIGATIEFLFTQFNVLPSYVKLDMYTTIRYSVESKYFSSIIRVRYISV